jgi:Lar family restriction alleviation protein
MSKPELKPCPFCGCEPEFSALTYLVDSAWVDCTGCYAGVRAPDDATAVANWNNRVVSAPMAESKADMAKSVLQGWDKPECQVPREPVIADEATERKSDE